MTAPEREAMKTIKIEITDRDSISSVCAKACLSAAAQYAEENGLVIVGERGEDGKIIYWFEERRR